MGHEWVMLATRFALMVAVLGSHSTLTAESAQPAAGVSNVVAPPQK